MFKVSLRQSSTIGRISPARMPMLGGETQYSIVKDRTRISAVIS
jgi:hypothetical protein